MYTKLSSVITIPAVLSLFLYIGCAPEPTPPKGMVYFEGGAITIGSEDGLPNEAPVFQARVSPFFMDKYPVTVEQFREFVKSTGYQTDAEKFGNSALFNFSTYKYELIDSVNWRYPLGRNASPASDNHPVTHVSWNDARAYASWAGKRLPTEVEWEYAARGGKNSPERYSWGGQLADKEGKFHANVWQGAFPSRNTESDGYRFTSPVGEFGITSCGLSDMGGNVWEWCRDTYRLYEGNEQYFVAKDNLKTIRGGSFMCDSLVCHGYRVSARQYTSGETSNFHLGFRCAMDATK